MVLNNEALIPDVAQASLCRIFLKIFIYFDKGEMGKPVRIENPDEETKKKIGKAQFPLFYYSSETVAVVVEHGPEPTNKVLHNVCDNHAEI
jgi:hypothetical protein